MVEICQTELPFRPWENDHTRRLPGVNPLDLRDWVLIDDAYAAQMAHRRALLADKAGDVLCLDACAAEAAGELLDLVLDALEGQPGFVVGAQHVTCPDGVRVPIGRDQPLATLGAIVQDDFVIMQKTGDEHVLTGAVLCFPASWTLAQKFQKPMTHIHTPVDVYDDNLAKRVQRIFDGIRVERPMWRANYLIYGDPELHQPRLEADKRPIFEGGAKWLRVERQAMRKLPQTGAVIFSIHTYVLSQSGMDALGLAFPPPAGR